jgi:hypothetical protein
MNSAEGLELLSKDSLRRIESEIKTLNRYLVHQNFPIDKKPEYFL